MSPSAPRNDFVWDRGNRPDSVLDQHLGAGHRSECQRLCNSQCLCSWRWIPNWNHHWKKSIHLEGISCQIPTVVTLGCPPAWFYTTLLLLIPILILLFPVLFVLLSLWFVDCYLLSLPLFSRSHNHDSRLLLSFILVYHHLHRGRSRLLSVV